MIVPLSAAVILEGLSNGTIDLAYLSATDMLNAMNQHTATILLAGEIDGKTSYQSYWVTLKDKPYQSVADLKGKPIAFSSKTSTSGYVIPLWDLRQKNLISDSGKAEEFFGAGNVWFGSGYVSAVERVLNGDAEAAAVSYYVLDKDKHLTAEQRQKLRRLAEQGPVPTHVIAIRSGIPDADRTALRDALIAMDQENSELRDRVFTSRLVEVDAGSPSWLPEGIDCARQARKRMTFQPRQATLRGVGLKRRGRWLFRGMDIEVPRGKFHRNCRAIRRRKDQPPGMSGGQRVAFGGRGRLSNARKAAATRRPTFASDWALSFRIFCSSAMERSFTTCFADASADIHGGARSLAFRARTASEAFEILNHLGLAPHVYRRAAEVSGGEQQRAALARALFQEPEMLLADEPVSNLDSDLTCRVLEILRQQTRRAIPHGRLCAA